MGMSLDQPNEEKFKDLRLFHLKKKLRWIVEAEFKYQKELSMGENGT